MAKALPAETRAKVVRQAVEQVEPKALAHLLSPRVAAYLFAKTVTRAEQAESRIAELESENARLKAAIEPAIEWARAELRASGNTHRSALFRSLVAGGFIEQSGERGK